MRFDHVVRSLASGVIVYLVAAACGSSDRIAEAIDGGESDVGSIADALIDGVINPVDDAKAEPLPPDIAIEKCDKTGSIQGSTSYAIYAVHDYPGKTEQDLSQLRVIMRLTAGSPSTPIINGNSYAAVMSSVALRPGSAAAYCGAPGNLTYDSATFILPK